MTMDQNKSTEDIATSLLKPEIRNRSRMKIKKTSEKHNPLASRQISQSYDESSEGSDINDDYLKRSVEEAKDVNKKILLQNNVTEGHIIFKNVSLEYTDYPKILCNISLEILPGQKVGIVGPKPSDLNSIAIALYRSKELYSGDITIDNEQLSTINVAKCMFILHKEPIIHSETIRDNLDPLRSYSDCEIIQALERVNMKSTLLKDGTTLDSQLRAKIQNLTSTQRQLFFLALAILKEPKVIIVKEVDLEDPNKVNEVYEAIKKLFMKTTVIFLTSHINTIKSLEKVYYLADGKVIEEGEPESLLKNSASQLSCLILKISESIKNKEEVKNLIFDGDGLTDDKNKTAFDKLEDFIDLSEFNIDVNDLDLQNDNMQSSDEMNEDFTSIKKKCSLAEISSTTRKTDRTSRDKINEPLLKKCNEPIVFKNRSNRDIFEDVIEKSPKWKCLGKTNSFENYLKNYEFPVERGHGEGNTTEQSDFDNYDDTDVHANSEELSDIKLKSKLRSEMLRKGRMFQSESATEESSPSDISTNRESSIENKGKRIKQKLNKTNTGTVARKINTKSNVSKENEIKSDKRHVMKSKKKVNSTLSKNEYEDSVKNLFDGHENKLLTDARDREHKEFGVMKKIMSVKLMKHKIDDLADDFEHDKEHHSNIISACGTEDIFFKKTKNKFSVSGSNSLVADKSHQIGDKNVLDDKILSKTVSNIKKHNKHDDNNTKESRRIDKDEDHFIKTVPRIRKQSTDCVNSKDDRSVLEGVRSDSTVRNVDVAIRKHAAKLDTSDVNIQEKAIKNRTALAKITGRNLLPDPLKINRVSESMKGTKNVNQAETNVDNDIIIDDKFLGGDAFIKETVDSLYGKLDRSAKVSKSSMKKEVPGRLLRHKNLKRIDATEVEPVESNLSNSSASVNAVRKMSK